MTPQPPETTGPVSITPQRPPAGKSLFSQHYLQQRLPDHPDWHEDPMPAFEALRALWLKARMFGANWNEAQTEDEFIRPALEVLGWKFAVQTKSQKKGSVARPDYALFADQAAKDAAYPHQGHDDAFYIHAVAIAEAKYWGRPLSQQDASGRNSWKVGSNPSHQMVSYLVGTRMSWGILTNGLSWRLYSREASSVASDFYEVDLGPIFDVLPTDGQPSPEQMANFKRWWLFFRRDALVPGSAGKSFVEQVLEGSATYARRISDKLKELVFEEVMPEIAVGIVAFRRRQLGVQAESEQSLHEIYAACLSLLYKLLFVLYAEARDLLPMSNTGYREQSLTELARWAALRIDQGQPISDATFATPRYDALLALFHRIDQGEATLGIPHYDGGLFNPTNPDNLFLERHKLSDRTVARVVDIMVRDAGEPVDYAYISVRNLGAIYEGLLENRLRVIDAAAGKVELVNDKGERKLSGSYYTPDYIVEYIVEQTLDPILDERAAQFATAMDRCAKLRNALAKTADSSANSTLRTQLEEAERGAREAFLGIKVCDPAMGSGHFLVNAVDHLTDGVILRIQSYHDTHPNVPWDWNPIQRLITRMRGDILAEMAVQNIAVNAARLDDTALLIRLVMKRCIYGVDLNAMAVELAKLSLWLHSFTIGAPLSFLDHHLRWGNSIIGTDVRTVERAMAVSDSGQFALFQGPFAGLLDLTAVMIEVAERGDATLADVQQSAGAYARFQAELTPYMRMLDLWVSQYFPATPAEGKNGGAPVEFMTLHSEEVRPALRGETQVDERYRAAIERARALLDEKRFFHWDLEFPEVFVDLQRRDWAENPGFDAVIGNPPYVRQEQMAANKPYFAAAHSQVYDGAADLYVYFYERGLELLRVAGQMAYIVNNKWLRAGYGEKLRGYFGSRARIESIVDFGHAPIFADADTFPCIVLLSKSEPGMATAIETEVCQLPREVLGQVDVAAYVRGHSLRVPAARFGSAPWSLEPPEVDALMRKIRDRGVPLSEYLRAEPIRGIITGLNEAFIIPDPIKERIVGQDPAAASLLKPCLRGQDIKRWAPEWADIWMILLKSSENQEWPWSNQAENAEAVFAQAYPSIYEHLKPYEARLRSRQDHGRFWWELRSCAYYAAFEVPKIMYQEIQFHSAYCLDTGGRFSNNKAFLLKRDDRFLLAVLNSPLMWWHNWRYLPHMKDEALTPTGELMVRLPVASPAEQQRDQAETAVAAVLEHTDSNCLALHEVLDWLRLEFGVELPGQQLEAMGELDEQGFIQQVRARRPRGAGHFSPAAIAALRSAYQQYIPAIRAAESEIRRLEQTLSDLVNEAYGLTPEDVALMWRTAPPRMPIANAP